MKTWFEARCIASWSGIPHGVLPGAIASVMEPGRPLDGFVKHTRRVSPACLIHFERNRYRVPASFANRPVSLRVYPERIVIAAEGRTVFEYARLIERPITCRAGRASTGGTIWRSYRASPLL